MTEKEKACLAWKTIGHAKDVIKALYGTDDGRRFATPEIDDLYYKMVDGGLYFMNLEERCGEEEKGEKDV